jgi:rod shape-determining protein MreC
MRRNNRSNQLWYWILMFGFVGIILLAGLSGVFRPIQGLLMIPLTAISSLFNRTAIVADQAGNELFDVNALRQRNQELEAQLARITGELIELREISSDYERLTQLLNYTSANQDREYLTADVVGLEAQGFVRALIINKGSRDGLQVGMPVITELGLVGRVYDVTANSSRVQLITDQNSFVSSRLQTSRAEGSIQGRGLLTGSLTMRYIGIDSEIIVGDLVVTSGLGGNFPPDIVVGQVTSAQSLEFELSQEATISSFIDFSTLEFVLVITNFEPVDISIFDAQSEEAP